MPRPDSTTNAIFLPSSTKLPPTARALIAEIAASAETSARSSPAQQSLHLPLHAPLRAKILAIADACAADRAAMDDYTSRFPGGRAIATIIARPVFVELVRNFAASFTALTKIVDKAVVIGCPWRDLIADPRIEAGLDAGFDAEKQLILALAVKASHDHEQAAVA